MMTGWLATEIAVHCEMLRGDYPTPLQIYIALMYRRGAMRSRRFGRRRRVHLRGGV